jgi:large subunit ribosomal protein L21
MYAVIELAGKQHKVSPGDMIEVNKLAGVKQSLTISDVLLIDDNGELHIGQPQVKGAKVKLSIADAYQGVKTIAFKYKRRESYHRKVGYRPELMKLKVEEIQVK